MINAFFLCKNDFFFRSIEHFLNDEGIYIAGICKEPKNAVEHFKSSKADLVIMDANWTTSDYGITGLNIVRNFLNYDSDIKIICVTAFYEPKHITDLIEAGAKGYFYRNVGTIEKIASCIENVFSGSVDIECV